MFTSTSAANSTNSRHSGWTLFILVISRTRRGKKICSEFLGSKVVVTYTVTGEVLFIAGRTRSKNTLSEARKLPKTCPTSDL